MTTRSDAVLVTERSTQRPAELSTQRGPAFNGGHLVLLAIHGYQRVVSPLLGSLCRFHPSCSSYTATCVERFGATRGLWLGARRIARCHPFHPGGFDPPPEAPAPRDARADRCLVHGQP